MRVVSLLPAATEIVAALGLVDSLVGVSHECNYPPDVNGKPRVSHCEVYGKDLPSADVDRWVSDALSSNGALYTIDEPLLRELAPDVIVTQQLCDVCAIDYRTISAIADSLPGRPRLVSLSPSSFTDVLDDIRRVAAALGVPERGEALVASLETRVEAVHSRASRARVRPRCVQVEWIDPLYCSGHWNPELVEIAGGVDPLGLPGKPSVRTAWENLVAARPEVLVLACCGYEIERTLEDLRLLQSRPAWAALPAVRDGRVYAVNGCAYFSRPGPRLVDSLEILAQIIHPEIFPPRFGGTDVVRVDTAHALASR
jgi:iron complex transport system substrate-binding protein